MTASLDPLAAANRVLGTFAARAFGPRYTPGDGWRFDARPGGLWLVFSNRGEERAACCRLRGSDGLWPVWRYGTYGMGGTQAQAVAQLVRWVRGQTRRPLCCWRHWCGPSVALGTAETVPLLEAHGYAEPALTACVLCGAADATDWYSLSGDRRVGPLCGLGRCPARVVR